MRKIITNCILMGAALCAFTSCERKEDNFDLYRSYHNAGKGLEVYCWEQGESWYSGILLGTNRLKSVEEIQWLQDNLPCPLKTMRGILAEYKDDNEYIGVFYC